MQRAVTNAKCVFLDTSLSFPVEFQPLNGLRGSGYWLFAALGSPSCNRQHGGHFMFLVSREHGIDHGCGMPAGNQMCVVDTEHVLGWVHLGRVFMDRFNPLDSMRLYASPLHIYIPSITGGLGQDPLQLDFSSIG